jgi:DNA-binding CsgD family transcriptional regulator
MESPAETELAAARHLLRRVLFDARAAAEELRAANRELEILLEKAPKHAADEAASAAPSAVADGTALPPINGDGPSLDELRLEAGALIQAAREAMTESARLRQRSQQMRSAPLNGAKNWPGLSKREREVLQLMVAGKSSKQIAVALGISFKTAVTHRASIMSKLSVHEVASVVREAIRLGLA